MRFATLLRLGIALAFPFTGLCSLRAQEVVLYSFTGDYGAPEQPIAGLAADAKGNLYGTTGIGFQGGAVFEISPGENGTWTEKTIYPTSGSMAPTALLGGVTLDSKGNLYGTTQDGTSGCGGTVFELTSGADDTWTYEELYHFGGKANDGCHPQSRLVFDSKGNLYGTTYSGGAHMLGSVFELSPKGNGDWSETILWNFAGGPNDGSYPEAGVTIDPKGSLYGTTNSGGSDGFGGVVFELTPQTGGGWKENILHSFCPYTTCTDGFLPQAGVVFDAKGNLFGTAPYGGKYGATNGAVYELSPQSDGSWTETIVHDFHGAAGDGTFPVGGLVFDSKGNLYGTTQFGGTASAGTVFELTPGANNSWAEKILFRFDSPKAIDGGAPEAGLIFGPSDNLFGTTHLGGANNAGTVYEIFNPDRTGTPAFSIPAGMYTSAQTVKLSDYSPGATIYYTTNGETPTSSSEKYTTAIKVEHSETIKALAVAANLSESEVASAKYTIELPTATPVISPKGSTYTSVQEITIKDATTGAAIYYTTNGAMPTATSKRYAGPIKVAASETVKAIAIANGHTPSGVATANYTIHLPPTATPVFSPAGGTYPKTQSVTITDATSGAEIYFTINGDTPTASSSRYYGTAISVGKSKTLKAIAIAPGHAKSGVASATYTIQ